MLPEVFKVQILNYIDDLWSSWRSFGVYSEGSIHPIALEEAIIGLCIFGRYDQRLFDEALTFIIQNSNFISKNRLYSLLNKIDIDSKKVFHVISIFIEKYSNDKRFFTLSNEVEIFNIKPFFISLDNNVLFTGKQDDMIFLKSGFKRNVFTKSEKLRNLNFVSENNPWIKSKLLFGNTVRADTIMELIINDKCTAPFIAFNTGYTQKSIWNILNDFELAGFVSREKVSNKIIYSLLEKSKKQFKEIGINAPKYKNKSNISNWIKAGYYLYSLSKLPENASELLIKSEEKKIEKIVNKLHLVRDIL